MSVSFEAELRAEALVEFLDEWESAHTPLTLQELAQAERELELAVQDQAT